MSTRKKTTRRKSSKPPSPAQLRARAKFIAMVRAKSKAGRKKAVRRNPPIDLGRLDYSDRKKKWIVVLYQGNRDVKKGEFETKAQAASELQRLIAERRKPAKRRNKTIITKPKKVIVINKLKNGTTTRRKYRNGYLDLVIMGHAKKTPSGWSLGGKTFKQGRGIVPASKRGYYLDLGTGTVFSKKARNPVKEVASHMWRREGYQQWLSRPFTSKADAVKFAESKPGDVAVSKHVIDGKPKGWTVVFRNPSKKRNADHRDSEHPIEVTKHFRSGPPGYMTPWQRAHSQGQQGLFDHGIKAAKKRNAKKKASRRRVNPSVKSIRKEFAGTLGKASDVFAPIGTPRNVAKLGKLLFIDTENATIKPTGIVYLCADTKGKLHLCGSKNVPIYSGGAQSFGRVKKLEYETAKPHLYPGQGTIQFWHKMGEESGNQPTLYADGKGGLKFRGGSYKITREGIVD